MRPLMMGLATVAMACTCASAAVYHQDFESLATDATTFPNFTSANTGTGRVLKVQGASSNKNGGKSFLFADTESTQGSSPTGVITFGSETQVTAQFDTWIGVAPSGGDIQFSLRGTKTTDSLEGEAVRIYMTAADILARHGNGTGTTNTTLQAGYSLNTRYRFVINADTLTDTYTVQMNGGTVASGRFVNNLLFSDLTKFQFTAGGSTAAQRVETFYVDDIGIVPEPTSLGLLSIAGAMVLRRRRA